MTSHSDDQAGAPHTHFGFETIPAAEKQGRVDEVFHRVAARYDLMNDLMSGGMHRLWKDAMITWLAPPRRGPFKVLDVAGGTGDIAFRIARKAAGSHVTVCDINESMLTVGRQRAEKQGLSGRVDFALGNAQSLPFPDRSFDAYTIAFGIRNVTVIEEALSEAFRVLRPGGRFMCLEFSPVDTPVLDRIYDTYSYRVIPAIGKRIVGDPDPYQYLVESIRRFPHRETFAEMIEDAGFERVSFRMMTGGVALLHSGWRL